MNKSSILNRTACAVLFAGSVIVSSAANAGSHTMPWTGVYIGGHLGYGSADISGIYDNADAAFTNLGALDPSGVIGGAQIGYNYQINQFVIGIEGDFTGSSVDDDILGAEPPPRGPDAISAEVAALASIRARFGVTFNQILLFGTVGLGWADYRLRATNALNGSTGSLSIDETGLVYGGGAEFMLSPNWTVRAEYLRYDTGTTISNLAAVPSFATNTDVDAGDTVTFDDVDVFRIAINWKL